MFCSVPRTAMLDNHESSSVSMYHVDLSTSCGIMSICGVILTSGFKFKSSNGLRIGAEIKPRWQELEDLTRVGSEQSHFSACDCS